MNELFCRGFFSRTIPLGVLCLGGCTSSLSHDSAHNPVVLDTALSAAIVTASSGVTTTLPPPATPIVPIPSVGAVCRGKSVDLLAALASKDCTVTEGVARRIEKMKTPLRFEMTVNPTKLRYDDAISIMLTITNPTTEDVPLSFGDDQGSELLNVTFDAHLGWFLPVVPAAENSSETHFGALILSAGGAARARLDTTMRAMELTYSMQDYTEKYREVGWDPGASFPSGPYTLSIFHSLLVDNLTGWSATVEVAP